MSASPIPRIDLHARAGYQAVRMRYVAEFVITTVRSAKTAVARRPLEAFWKQEMAMLAI
jgi:hypothetical protein